MKCPKCKRKVTRQLLEYLDKKELDKGSMQITLKPCGHVFRRSDDPKLYSALSEEIRLLLKIGIKNRTSY